MVHAVLLSIHIITGALGIILGPLVIWQETRRLRARLGTGLRTSAAYHWMVLLVSASSVALVVENRHDLWWLVPVAAITYGLFLLSRLALDRRFEGWTHAYVHGLGGSYIAQVTALIVVALTVDGPVKGGAQLIPWLLPTAVGTVLIEWWRRRYLVGRPSAQVRSTTIGA